MEYRSLFSPSAIPTLKVADLTQYLRQLLESDGLLSNVWVQGEVSNLSRPSSGHIYFTLKDESAALRCVIWRSNAARVTGSLQNGAAVEVHGYISLYDRDGQYQLYVDSVRFSGDGWLFQEFIRLKTRLEAEGLFDPSRKRPLPARPRVIGIVTSPTGAALQDMLNTLRGRYPLCEVVIAPTLVQGDDAPLSIRAAIQALCRTAHPDVIILARGGGSLEDLWAFNDERVVRAVVACPVPVVTGIGHETDFTLCDFAADLRAPTPTGAAVLCTPERADILRELAEQVGLLAALGEGKVDDLHSQLDQVSFHLDHLSPAWRVQNGRQRLDELNERLKRSLTHSQTLRHTRAQALQDRWTALNPLAVLGRGYALVTTTAGHVVKSADQLAAGDGLHVRLASGAVDAQVTRVDQEGAR